MKVTLNWLKQYVDFDWSPEQLAERLTMLGLEVEGVHKVGGEFDGVIVAQVITRDKHPNADKLSLCRVNDGQGERQIVCGAQNFKAGDKVPLILPGASLPMKPGEKEPFTIKVGKIRGVESHGMLCSPQELGLPDQIDGLLILREDAKVGQPFAEYLGRSGGDVVYDLEITPNRPDWNSVIGIARDIAALTGNPLKVPGIKDQASGENVQALVAVRIEDAELCPRYTARVVKGVKIGPSPDWLRSTLEKIGIRSINNVVDVTNFVMLEIGQPLHAFDYHLIAKGKDGKPAIVVRRAGVSEKFKTLDNVERTLNADMLLIADEQKGIALAGVMGGQNTEINDSTKDVLIESAYFNPTNIRRTSKTLALRSESSYRFERGADVGICDWASQRAAQLILETAGGQLAEGVVDAYPKPAAAKQIALRHHKVGELLGVSIPPAEQIRFLKNLGLRQVNLTGSPHVPMVASNTDTTTLLNKEAFTSSEGAIATFEIPTFRVDLKREVDLIEEIARLYGVEKIPATPSRGAIGSNAYDAVHDQIAEARCILSGLGLNEAQGQTLISDRNKDLFEPNDSNQVIDKWIYLQNPLSQEMNILRPTLLPGLLDSIRINIHRGTNDVSLFEVGRIFFRDQNFKPDARRNIALAVTGNRTQPFWNSGDKDTKYDAYDLKGIIEEFLESFGVRGVTYQKADESNWLYLEYWTISLGDKIFGGFGQLNLAHSKRFDAKGAVFLAELNLDLLLARRNPSKSFKALPAFPAIRRDVAMLVPEATTHDAILQVVKQTKPANLESVELFDVFRGKNVPEGQKSLAYAFTYRNPEKTLTDAEATAAHEKLVEQFKKVLGAALRE